MDEALELSNYLPLSFKTYSEQEYIAFLWDAFEANYNHGNHQFAFLAYHMLTMSFVYFNIWQIKQTEPKDFGRIAAQTAKQVIIQKVKDAERENIYAEYKDRKNDIVTGLLFTIYKVIQTI